MQSTDPIFTGWAGFIRTDLCREDRIWPAKGARATIALELDLGRPSSFRRQFALQPIEFP